MLKNLSYTKKTIFSILLIVILTTIIYSNTFDATFHFDDKPSIVENYAIHRFDLKEIFSSSRPILEMTFALNYYFGKLNVFGYHLVNIMLHIANGIMLFFILLWTINPINPKNTTNPINPINPTNIINSINSSNSTNSTNFRLPLYASLIFVSHPIQTQAVTYIVSRSSVLATTFYLLALLFFIKAYKLRAESEEPVRTPSKGYIGGAFLAACLAMGTKQIAATLPVMLLIYDFYFISDGSLKRLKHHWIFHLLMFSTIAIAVYLSFAGLKMSVAFDYSKGVPMPQEAPITSFQYFLTQLHVIPYYIKLLFIPTNLNLDYDWPITRSIDFTTAAFFILLTSLIILAVFLFRRARLVSFGIIWFFVTLSVTSSFIVIFDVIFEHRLYLPSVGFAMVVAFMISKISELRKTKRLTPGAL